MMYLARIRTHQKMMIKVRQVENLKGKKKWSKKNNLKNPKSPRSPKNLDNQNNPKNLKNQKNQGHQDHLNHQNHQKSGNLKNFGNQKQLSRNPNLLVLNYPDNGKGHQIIIWQQWKCPKRKKVCIVQKNLNLASIILIPLHSLKLTYQNQKRRQKSRKLCCSHLEMMRRVWIRRKRNEIVSKVSESKDLERLKEALPPQREFKYRGQKERLNLLIPWRYSMSMN